MRELGEILIGDWHRAVYAAIKAFTLFLTAVVLFRFSGRRTLAEFAPYDWVAAVAVGAIVGRTATASDASWLVGAAALVVIMLTHAALTRLRFLPRFRGVIDPPLLVLVRDGAVDERNLRRCGMTTDDLAAVLRQHGHDSPTGIHRVFIETRGAVSILPLP